MAAFYNQASINLGGSVTNSNITVGEITSGITLTKTAATSEYGAGEGITYVVSAVNSGLSEYNGLTLTDDLGRFTVGAQVITPLTYVEGSLIFYLDGVIQPAPTVTLGETLAIGPFNIPAGSNATVIYEARANQTAPLDAGASITNTVTLVGGSCELSDSATVPTRDEPRLTIAKAVCPQSVTCAGEITYTVIIQNLGNTPVVATDDLIVNDTFNPILNNITVTLDGTALAEGAGYTCVFTVPFLSTGEGRGQSRGAPGAAWPLCAPRKHGVLSGWTAGLWERSLLNPRLQVNSGTSPGSHIQPSPAQPRLVHFNPAQPNSAQVNAVKTISTQFSPVQYSPVNLSSAKESPV